MADVTPNESTEEPVIPSKDKIVYRIITQEELPQIIRDTIENQIAQVGTKAQGFLLMGQYERAKQFQTKLAQMHQALMAAMRHTTEELPIDERYKDHPMIALSEVQFSEKVDQQAA